MHESPKPTSTPADEWEQRYRARDQIWSGHPNGSLVAELEGTTPGRVLDVGCGEGADAIWLATNGWQVTAVDIAPSAVARGRAEADRRGLTLEWSATDLLADPPTARFDLVTLHYPGFPIDQLDDVVAMLTGAVAPGGTLLVVGHAPPADPATSPFNRDEWVQAEDIRDALDDAWTIETDDVRPRPGDHHAGSPHIDDVVVRARRP